MVTINTPKMTPIPPMSCWAVGSVSNNIKVHNMAATGLSVNTMVWTLICMRLSTI